MKKKLKLFAFFAMLPVAALLTSAVPDCPLFAAWKVFPNPNDCTTFYVCSNGHAVLEECPDDLYFCEELEACSWSWEPICSYNCDSYGGTIDPIVIACGASTGACWRGVVRRELGGVFPLPICHWECSKFSGRVVDACIDGAPAPC